jgi:hypothetical protein
MSAFLAYGGAYEFAGREYRWRCYATARVYEVRKREHSPSPQAPNGRQWVTPQNDRRDPGVMWLMDEGIEDFSQMLVQVEPQAPPPSRRYPLNALPAH